jgi:hypothetical protein
MLRFRGLPVAEHSSAEQELAEQELAEQELAEQELAEQSLSNTVCRTRGRVDKRTIGNAMGNFSFAAGGKWLGCRQLRTVGMNAVAEAQPR